MNQEYLKEELKKYGFFYLEGQIPERQARQFLTVKKLTPRENLVFIPKKEVCFERMLSKYTSLYIEGLERYSDSGVYLGYTYDFYKATYLFNSQPRRLKIYGTQLSARELLYQLKGFSFLRIEKE
ncbi:hypothetical protein ACEXFN_000673 [Listeria monocytogenes]|uniref:Uncharacterized protein n=1 Tax=Listeria monocytogenes TaxID=1639 RepID=A0AAD2RCK0_LISMN|nr:hypothetical protein [Listeria monocytogenes]MCZ62149.1 hypothetical protein [Listeria monocytogenes serotype 4b]HAA0102771.1 hypothetical protein [Listeria monocytogenes CC70B]AQP73384.1 hypothetical protein B0X18_04750 [Listeria monocytogenes]ASH66645.1 hypothetical protein A417_0980 [Listeria monocytogenes serotype 4b str. 02-1103]ASH69563.1 hypothetical protein A418_0980 [Listeria monocytogenes serotype 4b str. 02-1289]